MQHRRPPGGLGVAPARRRLFCFAPARGVGGRVGGWVGRGLTGGGSWTSPSRNLARRSFRSRRSSACPPRDAPLPPLPPLVLFVIWPAAGPPPPPAAACLLEASVLGARRAGLSPVTTTKPRSTSFRTSAAVAPRLWNQRYAEWGG